MSQMHLCTTHTASGTEISFVGLCRRYPVRRPPDANPNRTNDNKTRRTWSWQGLAYEIETIIKGPCFPLICVT